MNRFRVVICIISILVLSMAAYGDVVTDWNEITLQAIKAAKLPAPQASRVLAIVHIAIYDTVNSIERQGEPFYVSTHPSVVSEDAAVVAAAYTALVNVVPSQQAMLYQERAASLAQIPDSRLKQTGISWGGYVGSVAAYMRKYDGWNEEVSYTPIYEPGFWRPTPPAYADILDPNWGDVQPFAVPNLQDYLPGPPPDLSTKAYARGVNETKRLGARNSAVRTADQTEIAYFWSDDAGSISPPGRWNRIAQVVSESMGNSLFDNARLFALLNIAMADSTISCWQCKLYYSLWRPITAIREADSAGNPLVVQNKKWTPLLTTPPFPEYTAGHSTLGAAAAEVLALFYGDDNIPFDLYSEVTDTTRSFSSFTEACEENGRSRIYGGIHYQFSNLAGQKTGREIGQYVFENVLRM